MEIGIPKEIKVKEGRVALIPAAVAELVHLGHTVYVQSGAGELSGYNDDSYRQIGAQVVPDAAAVYEKAKLLVKVKEPIEGDLKLLRSHHTLFCYLHLAANEQLTTALQEIGLCAVAFETVEHQGHLPLLAPMSDIAGRLAVQIGSQILQHHHGGKGLMLGGLPGTERGHVVVIGAGSVGGNAVRVAAQLGANVTVFARRREQQSEMMALGHNVTAVYPYRDSIARAVSSADLLVGAVLSPGAKAPHLVSSDMVKAMGKGSVVVDVAVDQGGCIETTRPTNYEQPTYLWHDIVHFGVTNMPGAVPRTASQALCNSLLPWVIQMANKDWDKNHSLSAGINVRNGKIVLPALKQ